jgi:hypothetical protein
MAAGDAWAEPQRVLNEEWTGWRLQLANQRFQFGRRTRPCQRSWYLLRILSSINARGLGGVAVTSKPSQAAAWWCGWVSYWA